MRTPKPILDRRRSIRIEDNLPFTIGHEESRIVVRTMNVSSHGALCRVNRDIPVMTQLEIGLSVPAAKASRSIRLQGVVVRKEKVPHTGDYLVAIYFSQVKPKDQKILDDYIRRRLEP